jgi:hypothetical protein
VVILSLDESWLGTEALTADLKPVFQTQLGRHGSTVDRAPQLLNSRSRVRLNPGVQTGSNVEKCRNLLLLVIS